MNTELKTADVVVVGAGMVGAAAALGLAQQGLSVLLVEAHDNQPQFDPAVVDNRVSALTRASQRLLEKLGVWPAMQAMRVNPYTDMHVWDAGGSGAIHFDAAELGESSLGHIVENSVTQLALWQALDQHENVEWLRPAKVTETAYQQGRAELMLDTGQQLSAQLVIAADGKRSALRDMLGIQTRGWSYDQHAVVGTVSASTGHQNTAWQRFMPEGPLALLPLGHAGQQSCSIVWSTSPDSAEILMDMDDEAFCEALTAASEGVLGDVTAIERRGVFPLELMHAQNYIREGFMLIGDAAHAIHPLAGQGVNLGFDDVICLLQLTAEAQAAGRSIGSWRLLRRYERERKGANMTMLAAMDGFKRLFSNDLRSLALLRNSGLSLVDRLGPVKHFLTRYAMGLGQARF